MSVVKVTKRPAPTTSSGISAVPEEADHTPVKNDPHGTPTEPPTTLHKSRQCHHK